MSKFYDIIRDILTVAVVLAGVIAFSNMVPKADAAPPPGGYFNIPTEKFCSDQGFPCPEGDTGVDMAQNLAKRLAANVRYIIGAVAVIIIIVSGVKLITAQGNEEVWTKEQETIMYAIIGLFVIGLAGEIGNILDVRGGGLLSDPNVALQKSKLFTRTVTIVITFIKYIIGSVAVLFIVRSGLRLVMVGDREEEVGKDKKSILYGLLGLVIILISDPIVNKVFFKIDTNQFPGTDAVRPAIDRIRLVQEISGATNIIAGIAGPVALIALVIGGLLYTLSAGEDEKIGRAKRIITWSLIALVIIYGAFAIVSTFVAREFTGI